jgi:hypothetical protein
MCAITRKDRVNGEIIPHKGRQRERARSRGRIPGSARRHEKQLETKNAIKSLFNCDAIAYIDSKLTQ